MTPDETFSATRVAGRITGDRTTNEDFAAEALARTYSNWSDLMS